MSGQQATDQNEVTKRKGCWRRSWLTIAAELATVAGFVYLVLETIGWL